jgi:hypothetical protein
VTALIDRDDPSVPRSRRHHATDDRCDRRHRDTDQQDSVGHRAGQGHRDGCRRSSPGEAFATLRRTSSRTNVKLNQLALDLVEGVGSQSSSDGLHGLLGHLDLADPDLRRHVGS